MRRSGRPVRPSSPPAPGRRRGWLRRDGRLAAASATGAVVVLLAACGGGTTATTTPSTVRSTTTSTGTAGSTPPAPSGTTAPVSSTVAGALTTALRAERETEATYANVLARLGQITPFVNVHEAETQHVAALELAAKNAQVPLPAGTAAGLPSPSTRTAACMLGVSVEQGMIALYNQLLPQVTSSAAVTQVFTNLQTASRDEHLPAFQHCI